MRNVLTLSLCLLAHSVLYSQVDSSAESFFPSAVGNVWTYEDASFRRYKTSLTRDSTANGSRYLFFDNVGIPLYQIDSTLNVFKNPTKPAPHLVFKLGAKQGETWIVQDTTAEHPTTRIAARVDAVFREGLFETNTQLKKISYFNQPVNDTTDFQGWYKDEYLAAGFGFYISLGYGSIDPDTILIGCVINGVAYGDTVVPVDSSAESFFPANIGDSWHYRYTQNLGYITTLTRDSVANGSRYLFFDNANVPLYKVDSSLNVFRYPTKPIAALQYKLTAKTGDTWIVEDTSGGSTVNIVAKVENIFWQYVLGVITQVKQIGYYYQLPNDTTNFNSWRNDEYIAGGFGFYLEITDAMQTPALWLAGCIINGVKYGTISSVFVKSEGTTLLNYKLFSAFPNPFNPSTVVGYQLPENNIVSLKVYDMLGREITTLINEEQQKGYYQFRFTPQNLSSGVYLVRMTARPKTGGQAGNFTQTTKIIYSK